MPIGGVEEGEERVEVKGTKRGGGVGRLAKRDMVTKGVVSGQEGEGACNRGRVGVEEEETKVGASSDGIEGGIEGE